MPAWTYLPSFQAMLNKVRLRPGLHASARDFRLVLQSGACGREVGGDAAKSLSSGNAEGGVRWPDRKLPLGELGFLGETFSLDVIEHPLRNRQEAPLSHRAGHAFQM